MFNQELINKFLSKETPFYYYDLNLLQNTIYALTKESSKRNYKVHYALKANSNEKILKMIKDFGLGADCVSGNEVDTALRIGFKNNEIVFAGVGKSDKEILTALKNKIFCFNVESLQELEVINSLAVSINQTAQIAIRINPNIDANTHHYITTGLEENKFGINVWELVQVNEKINSLKNLKLIGLHFHIGSQITDPNVYRDLCVRINDLQRWFNDRNIKINHINTGGGLGVNYESPDENLIPDFKTYFNIFEKFLELMPGQELHFEIGRAIVAQCGSLISKVLYIKDGVNTNFAILDAGMTELIRPALYQSYHKIENITQSETMPTGRQVENSNSTILRYDVVGPICESSDTFGKAILLPETKRGDLLAIRSTGAYGEVMSSNYNLREKVKAYYSDEI
jgi:diaminopimelate decarboxylase